MPKLPEIKPKQVEKVLYKLGFNRRHGKGSHIIFKHIDGRRTVIPVHNHPIRTGTLKAILRQIDISTKEFLNHL